MQEASSGRPATLHPNPGHQELPVPHYSTKAIHSSIPAHRGLSARSNFRDLPAPAEPTSCHTMRIHTCHTTTATCHATPQDLQTSRLAQTKSGVGRLDATGPGDGVGSVDCRTPVQAAQLQHGACFQTLQTHAEARTLTRGLSSLCRYTLGTMCLFRLPHFSMWTLLCLAKALNFKSVKALRPSCRLACNGCS